MIEILRKLRAEHDDMAKVLDVLEQEIASYRQDGRLNRDIVRDVLDYCRGYAEVCHHPKEDLIYRKLRLAAQPAAINAVGDLLAEHETLSQLTDELEAALDNLLSDAAEDRARFVGVAQPFVERHRQHLKSEDDELFPIAVQCLSDEDWAEIERGAADLDASHPPGAIDERFAALSRLIVVHESLLQRLGSRDTW
jgi:hemerythrin-like domain-containing protein